DFNRDGYDDLAGGAPEETLGNIPAGSVIVIPSNKSTLPGTGSKTFTHDTAGVPGAAEAGDRFGIALTAVAGRGTGADGLAVGASWQTVGAVQFAGWVGALKGGS